MFNFHFISIQSQLSRAKNELDNEKRELVRTLERRLQEVEHLNGMLSNFIKI